MLPTNVAFVSRPTGCCSDAPSSHFFWFLQQYSFFCVIIPVSTKIDFMDKTTILWADDEIDLLKPHNMFLEQKGYEVITANSGSDAIDLVRDRHFDIVFLDEQMPGISGIEALEVIKREFPNLPVVMITKSEEERIMEDAIGSNIADYLIKPVNPNQILLSLKRNLENRKLRDEKSSLGYQQEFRKISMDITSELVVLTHTSWTRLLLIIMEHLLHFSR